MTTMNNELHISGLSAERTRQLLAAGDPDAQWMEFAQKNFSCGSERQFHRVDVVWMLVCGFRVFSMQGGFALLESGVVRKMHVVSVMLKNLGDVMFGGFAWWALGYGIAFGNGDKETSGFMNDAVGDRLFFAEPYDFAFWFFQYSFAATATTIVSGMIAERASISFYLYTSLFITGIVYPVVVHWVWNPAGWLAKEGYVDFAGSSVVHVVGGFAGLAYIQVLGPRTGRFTPGKEIQLPPVAPGLPNVSYTYRDLASSPVYILFGTDRKSVV